MVASPELRAYIDREAGTDRSRIHLVNASPLVELVEDGTFLSDPEKTRNVVDAFMKELDDHYPNIAAVTLSSTHLPWLLSYLENARPGWPFLDPLNDAIKAVEPHSVPGTGRLLALATENERYPVAEFRTMLGRLGVSTPVYTVG